MARFTHPGITASGDNYSNNAWDLQGGTLGVGAVQPTFDGDPLFIGDYILIDNNLCHFDIEVDFDNITSFGTGQYYLTLPFPSLHDYTLNGGRLTDTSNGDFYSIVGTVPTGSNVLTLSSVGSNGRAVIFDDKTPITLSTADAFNISGTYQIDPTLV